MRNYSGYRIKGKSRGALKHWSCLLEEWVLAVDRYCRITQDDTPYWYNERANVGILAGAAWRCGWIALEEFQSYKMDMSQSQSDENINSENPQRWLGRADLYLGSDNHHENIEAKFKWVCLTSDKKIQIIEDCLDRACKDALNAKGDGISDDVGMCFIPFYIKEAKADMIDEKIDKLIEELSGVKADAYAWNFPQTIRSLPHEVSKNIRPGIAVFAKKIRA